jgi:hypothetical protein
MQVDRTEAKTVMFGEAVNNTQGKIPRLKDPGILSLYPSRSQKIFAVTARTLGKF